MAELVIRKMELADVEQVTEVEQATFSSPWPADVFQQEVVDNQHAYYFVLELEKKIIGYAGTWIVVDDAQITNIAVDPIYRGNKFGEKLFRFTLQQVMMHGAVRLSLEVRVSNVPAQKLYRKFGLVPGGVRKNYYTDNQEDALVMWVNLQ